MKKYGPMWQSVYLPNDQWIAYHKSFAWLMVWCNDFED